MDTFYTLKLFELAHRFQETGFSTVINSDAVHLLLYVMRKKKRIYYSAKVLNKLRAGVTSRLALVKSCKLVLRILLIGFCIFEASMYHKKKTCVLVS